MYKLNFDHVCTEISVTAIATIVASKNVAVIFVTWLKQMLFPLTKKLFTTMVESKNVAVIFVTWLKQMLFPYWW